MYKRAEVAAYMAAKKRGVTVGLIRYITSRYFGRWHTMRELAGNPCTPEDVLTQCATYPISSVRVALANNRKAPSELRQQLSLDDAWLVRWALTQNPSTEYSILRMLAEDKDDRVSKSARHKLTKHWIS